MEVHQGQFVFLTDKHVLRQRLGGPISREPQDARCREIGDGAAFDFLVAGSERVACFRGRMRPRLSIEGGVRQAVFDPRAKAVPHAHRDALWRVTLAGSKPLFFDTGK
jgi:hypothetical protein